MNRNRQMNAAERTLDGRIETGMTVQIAQDVHFSFLSALQKRGA
jgi:hypothetical protein